MCLSLHHLSLTVEGVVIGLQSASDGLVYILLLHTLDAQVLKTESKQRCETETHEACVYSSVTSL